MEFAMLNFLSRIRSKKASKPRQKKRRIPLAIEQLEVRWLFNRSPLTLLDEMGIVADDNPLDDLDKDFDVLGKHRHGGGGGIPATETATHSAPVGDAGGSGAGHQTNLSVSGGTTVPLGTPPSPTGGSSQALAAPPTSSKTTTTTTATASGPPSPNTTTVISNVSGGSGIGHGPVVAGPNGGNGGPFCFSCGGTPDFLVIDANEALVLSTTTAENTFSNWSMDLQAESDGSVAVSTWLWNTSNAPDATSITGSSSYRLQFTWKSFTGAARTDSITLTTNSSLSKTYTFKVDGTDSPAWSSQVDFSSNWPRVIQPDAVTPQQAAAGAGPYYQVGLQTGELQTSHSLPSYNPNIPVPIRLVYNSTMADAEPIFIVLFQVDPSQSSPNDVYAQLTFNGSTGSNWYYSLNGADDNGNSWSSNPGALLQIVLQGNATGLSTGRYAWTIKVTADYATPVTTTWTGNVDVVNDKTGFLGAGWSLGSGLTGPYEQIYPVTGGVILDQSSGTNLWFASSGGGNFTTPAGDTSTLVQNGDNSYTQTLKDGTKYNFNSSGFEITRVDTNNRAVTYAYNGSNQLITATDWNNQVTTFGYSGSYVNTITDPAGRTTTLTHSAAQLTSIQDPDGSLWSYGYDTGNRMTTLTNPLSKTTSVTYDGSWKRVTSISRPDGTSENFAPMQMQGIGGTINAKAVRTLAAQANATYTDPRSHVWNYRTDWLGFGRTDQLTDPLSNMTATHTDANGNPYLPSDPLADRTRQFFDSKFNPTSVVGANNTVNTMTYNAFSEVLTSTDGLGHVSTSTYDSNGNLTKVQDALGNVTSYTYLNGLMQTQVDALGRTTSYGYNASNELITVTDPLGEVTSYGYDSKGNRITVTDPAGETTTTSYDALNRPIAVTDPLGHTTSTIYDTAGNVSATVDPLNHRTSYSYDAQNRLIQIQDPLGHLSTVGYDNAGNVLDRVDPLGRRTTYSYDSDNRLTQVQDPIGNLSTTVYDTVGNVQATVDALNNRTTFGYDSLNRLVQTTDANNHLSTVVYDAANNTIAAVDGLNHRVTYGYDADNRRISTTDSLNHITTYGFDAVSNEITVTDALARTTTTGFDALYRQSTVTDPRGAVTSYAYDLAGRLRSITDPDSNITTYGFDNASRMTSMQDALGTATYVYDNANRKTDSYDRDGRHTQFAFDNANRETTETWLDGNGGTIRTVTYSYDNANEVTQITDPNSTLAYTYDNDGRVKTVDTNGTAGLPRVLLTYTYDAAGNKTNITDNLGGAYTLGYDAVHNLTSDSMTVSGSQGPQVTLAYDAANRMTGVTRYDTGSNNIVAAYSYDNADRLTTITYNGSVAGALATYAYGYDQANQLTSYTGPEGNLTYTYDSSSELTGVGNARSETYSYDLNGNRNYGSYTTGPGNELTGNGTYTFAYDSEGNMTSKTRLSDGETWTNTWDYRNRLTQVVEKTSAGVTVTNDQFTYDALNRRIGKSVNGTQTWMAYDGDNSFADFNSGGALTMRYLTGNAIDQLFARRDGSGNNAWYLTDLLGSVRQLAQTNGTILDALTFDSYGNILTETNSGNGDRFKVTGREWDSEIGLQFNRARYYDPGIGRWISQDPSGFAAGDADLYRYVTNSPIVRNDPTGLGPAIAGAAALDLSLTQTGLIPIIVRYVPTGAALGATGTFALAGSVAIVSFTLAYEYSTTLPWENWVITTFSPSWYVVGAAAATGDPAIGMHRLRTIVTTFELEGTEVSIVQAHRKGARESTQEQHQRGERRVIKDRGGEKGDTGRRPPRKRPPGHRGPWP
jgi:RHS repeat-associated protein